MKKLLRHWPLTLAALLALLCAFCLWRLWAVSNALPSQQAAKRWKGEGERDFAQISCFMPPLAQLTLDDVYKFRGEMYQKLKGAGYDIESEKGLYLDAWSAFNVAKVSNGRRVGDVQLVAVGGSFFNFHPLRLISGSYIQPDDVMDDRVLLDKETAWLLFGAFDVAGMSFSLDGTPVVVAGVYEHEKDAFSKLAYGEDMRIYMSYSAYERIDSLSMNLNDGTLVGAVTNTVANAVANTLEKDVLRTIICYEAVIAEPVKGFAYGAVTEKFPLKTVSITENTYRFETDRLFKLLKGITERSMRRGTYYFPYWENAARAAEDRAALWLLLGVVTGVFPIALLFYELIRYAVKGKKKLEDEILPNTGKKSRELVRAWSRRRWERKHPDEVQADEYEPDNTDKGL